MANCATSYVPFDNEANSHLRRMDCIYLAQKVSTHHIIPPFPFSTS